jgi:23S rRNA G2445 N2-methylase RlmL
LQGFQRSITPFTYFSNLSAKKSRAYNTGGFDLPRLNQERALDLERYFATCGRGIEPVLTEELRALGAEEVEPGRGGVSFRGDLAILYQSNLWLRTAIRVLRPILEVIVSSPDELYEAVRSLDWSRYLTPDHTLAVDCNVRASRMPSAISSSSDAASDRVSM